MQNPCNFLPLSRERRSPVRFRMSLSRKPARRRPRLVRRPLAFIVRKASTGDISFGRLEPFGHASFWRYEHDLVLRDRLECGLFAKIVGVACRRDPAPNQRCVWSV